MLVTSANQAKSLIGKRLYWSDECSRWSIDRSGILTGVYRNQICFDDSQDYKSIKCFNKLRLKGD
jgi:hypothetical protein